MTTDMPDSPSESEDKKTTTPEDKSTSEDGQEPEPEKEPVRRFIKVGKYKSKDPDNADVIILEVESLETFATKYSTCVNVKDRHGKRWILPLKGHDSLNESLW